MKKPKFNSWYFFSNLLSIFIWIFLLIIGVVFYYYYTLPEINFSIESTKRKPTITILDSEDNEIREIGSPYGEFISIDNLPSSLHAAILSIEDRRFYSHPGIDFRALIRAFFVNFNAGYIVQGGSTITQQLAKNLFLTPERTLSRKIREALLAIWLERNFTKDQILSLYLNRVYLGAGTYGVSSASKEYFGLSVEELSIYQSAMLSGLMKAPSKYNPKTNIDAARKRTETVLMSMVDAGYISKKELQEIERDAKIIIRKRNENIGRYYTDWIISQLESMLGKINQDLEVVTTIDKSLQLHSEKIIQEKTSDLIDQSELNQAALIVLSNNGAVKAMVGGRDYSKSQFNRSVNAKRQPGSAFKPFVYLSALEAGMLPNDTIEDKPININGWKPRNFSDEYEGRVTLEEALSRSINTVAVRIARLVGAESIINIARRFGFTSTMSKDLSIALGTSEVSLLELTSAYVPFANGGNAIIPYGIEEIKDSNGKIIYRREGSGLGSVISAPHLSSINKMLKRTIVDGTGRFAKIDRPAAAKTGTSQNFRDAWFIGYSPDFISGVWVGNDDGSGMNGVTGGTVPAKIWKDIMLKAHDSYPPKQLPGESYDKDSNNGFSNLIKRILGKE
ncbi:MAG: hypothetical protein CBC47_07795 [Alphaproteobacteria bacterium TMED87]|nr:penicillin-binding protein [Rhodospirillaceae bacterium]OUV08267.1 MAG: hypothetical protein CBC47_07795 [Alphaproteobacteria bacterium TMED87]